MILPTPIPEKLIQQLQRSLPRRIAQQTNEYLLMLSDECILNMIVKNEVSEFRQLYPLVFLHLGYLLGVNQRQIPKAPERVLQDIASNWHTDAEHMILEVTRTDTLVLSWYWQGRERRELNEAECELLASQCSTVCRSFIRGQFDQIAFDFPFKPPQHYRLFDNYIIGKQSFDKSAFTIYLPLAAVVDSDSISKDTTVTWQTLSHCHLPPQLLPASLPNSSTIPIKALLAFDQTLNLIMGNLQQVPTLAMIAEAQSISERTLKRRLQAASCHYQQLLSHIRCHHSLLWLDDPQYSISNVSEKLGYASVANFSKAFRHWTGVSPTRARQQLMQAKVNNEIIKLVPRFHPLTFYW